MYGVTEFLSQLHADGILNTVLVLEFIGESRQGGQADNGWATGRGGYRRYQGAD
jgi:hypothetical protein